MPVESWQFWLVTIIVLIAVIVLIRPFVPRWKKEGSCCGSASKPKKTKLTTSVKPKSKL
jgi:hypothetical protein